MEQTPGSGEVLQNTNEHKEVFSSKILRPKRVVDKLRAAAAAAVVGLAGAGAAGDAGAQNYINYSNQNYGGSTYGVSQNGNVRIYDPTLKNVAKVVGIGVANQALGQNGVPVRAVIGPQGQVAVDINMNQIGRPSLERGVFMNPQAAQVINNLGFQIIQSGPAPTELVIFDPQDELQRVDFGHQTISVRIDPAGQRTVYFYVTFRGANNEVIMQKVLVGRDGQGKLFKREISASRVQ